MENADSNRCLNTIQLCIFESCTPVLRIQIQSDPELFAGSESRLGSGINHFGFGSGQSGSGMNLITNFSVKK